MSRKRVVIAGGSGFIGTALINELLEYGYEPHVLTRSEEFKNDKVDFSTWDGKTIGPWAEVIDGSHSVINLAGHPINCKWTPENRQKILESRIDSTAILGKAISMAEIPPLAWINASGIDIYPDASTYLSTKPDGIGEVNYKGTGFLANLASTWERTMYDIKTPHTYKVALRTGMVLGTGGAGFEMLYKLTRYFLGSAIGNGKQYISWIHIRDLVRLYRWILENDISGPINATSPNPITNAELMATFRKALHRPWVPPTPVFMVKIFAGLMGIDPQLLLESNKVLPVKALESGFQFLFPEISQAIEDLVKARKATNN